MVGAALAVEGLLDVRGRGVLAGAAAPRSSQSDPARAARRQLGDLGCRRAAHGRGGAEAAVALPGRGGAPAVAPGGRRAALMGATPGPPERGRCRRLDGGDARAGRRPRPGGGARLDGGDARAGRRPLARTEAR